MKVSKTDYKTMKEMLSPFLLKQVAYNSKQYHFMDYCQYTVNDILYIECILCIKDETKTIPIIEMIRICYPDVIIY